MRASLPRGADVVMAQSPGLGREGGADTHRSRRVQRSGKIHMKHAFSFKELVTTQITSAIIYSVFESLKEKKEKVCLHLEGERMSVSVDTG